MTQNQKITPLIFETYLAVIKNSVGSNLFKNFYAEINGEKTDITKNGELSCAFYTSSILALFKLIKEIHTTVDSTVKDLKMSKWESIKTPKIGSVVVWEKINFGKSGIHKHIGFYIGDKKAISNSSQKGYPIEHHFTFRAKRKIETFLWHLALDNAL
jgi:hypothetical protein